MKRHFLILILTLYGWSGLSQNLNEIKEEWLIAKKEKDRLYETKDDCTALMNFFSEDVVFYEKGNLMKYEWLVEYCPKLPKNTQRPDEIEKKEILLSHNTAYDILDETFYSEDSFTYRKVTTTIWKKSEDDWKIVHMNIGMHKEESIKN